MRSMVVRSMVLIFAIGPNASTWQSRNECDVEAGLLGSLKEDLKPVDPSLLNQRVDRLAEMLRLEW